MGFSSRFETALSFAARLHAEQVRKGSGVPYVSHLLAVAAIAIEHGADEDTAIAALLHDAIEDQGGIAAEEIIRRTFGPVVAEIVRGCTDADTIPKQPWRQRKEAYVAHVSHAPPAVRLVSASDKLHNARTVLGDYQRVGEQVWKRFTGGRDGTLWYYRALADTFTRLGPAALAAELDQVVAQIERLSAATGSEQ